MSDLSTPERVQARLEEIDTELGQRQKAYERAAFGWSRAQRDIEKVTATALLSSARESITEKKADGDLAAYVVTGSEHRAEYESLKAVRSEEQTSELTSR